MADCGRRIILVLYMSYLTDSSCFSNEEVGANFSPKSGVQIRTLKTVGI